MRSLHFDLLTGPQPRERYDLIYTLMTLHHIPDPSNLVMTFYLLLRNPGFLCIADLDAEDGSFHGMDSSVHRGFDRNALSETLLSIGFSRVDLQTCYEMKKETQKGEKVFPIFLLAAQKL